LRLLFSRYSLLIIGLHGGQPFLYSDLLLVKYGDGLRQQHRFVGGSVRGRPSLHGKTTRPDVAIHVLRLSIKNMEVLIEWRLPKKWLTRIFF
jgi:hypothetical protein